METDVLETPARTIPENLVLKHGAHASASEGMCAMEAVAYIAGEPHSDHPACACPVVASFMRSWNDTLPSDEERTRLLALLIPKLVGSRSTPEVERKRSMLALDWQIRTLTPAWLDLNPSLATDAANLRALSPIVDIPTAEAAAVVVRAAYSAAYSAARSAAYSAASSAARSAAYSAASSAAYSAAYSAAESAASSAAYSAAESAANSAAYSAARSAAYSAASSAARSAARSAANSAAYSAAKDVLAPTVTILQASALDLLTRMLVVTP